VLTRRKYFGVNCRDGKVILQDFETVLAEYNNMRYDRSKTQAIFSEEDLQHDGQFTLIEPKYLFSLILHLRSHAGYS
jgi:hypothetical protein